MSLAQAVQRDLSLQKLNNERASLDKAPPKRHVTENAVENRRRPRRTTNSHRKVVFVDPIAFLYLEEDDSTIVLDRWTRLQGYELYIVEQWICSRMHPTFVICTYTGDSSHSIVVNILAIPTDESKWSERLKIYFQAISQFNAREQETPLGYVMVTNLSAFPSSLTVISVPQGDVKKHRENFRVNENLKRMGCTGRAAMTLLDPPASTIARYHHLFQTSDAVPLKASVIELVKLCQNALVLYGTLDPIYVDGLLCDITEKAISKWWNDIGTEFHNVEPSDGILGPTTVAALLGLWIGAYNRLKSAGVAVAKDVLDLASMKRAVGHFQKANKIDKSRILNRETLDRLHRNTAKTASGEGWGVPRAVKSTVAELSGKGGEMVMGIVGAKDKAGISEIETLDIERFAHLVPGAKLRWIFQGKRPKTVVSDSSASDDVHGKVFGADGESVFPWTNSHGGSRREEDESDTATGHSAGDGKLRRLRGTVPGLRSHAHKHDHDSTDTEDEAQVTRHPVESGKSQDHAIRSPASRKARPGMERQYSGKPALDLALAVKKSPTTPVTPNLRAGNRLQPAKKSVGSDETGHREQLQGIERVTSESPGKKKVNKELAYLRKAVEDEKYQNFATEFDEQGPESAVLRRSKSALLAQEFDSHNTQFLSMPRRLSFSVLEGTFRFKRSSQNSPVIAAADAANIPFALQMAIKEAEQSELQELTARLLHLEQSLLPHADEQIELINKLEIASSQSLAELNNVYYSRLGEYQNMQNSSTDLIARERAMLDDDLRRIEGLGAKLDYELDVLASRMQEVEEGATEFEENVAEVEGRLSELIKEKSTEGSEESWLQRLFIFLSSGTPRGQS